MRKIKDTGLTNRLDVIPYDAMFFARKSIYALKIKMRHL